VGLTLLLLARVPVARVRNFFKFFGRIGQLKSECRATFSSTTMSAIADPVAVARFKALFGFEPSSTKRSVEEVDSLTVTVKKEERAQLKIDDRKAFDAHQKRACAAIADKKKKFSIMAPKKGAEELKTVYDVTDTIETFGKECAREDMLDVFRIVKPLTKSGDLVYLASDAPSRTNLLDHYNTLTLEEVTLHCELILFYSKPFDVENLHWSADKLIASCDLELEKKVQEKIKLLPKWQHRCGPILFKVMMDLILLTNEDGIHAIINFVRNLKLKDQTGENVSEVASLLRGAVTFLQNNKAVPTDIMEVAHKIMRECSTDAFVSEIDCIYFNHRQQVKTITLNDFLSKCESSYRTLSTPNADGKIVWAAGTSRKKPAGGFHANGNQAPSDSNGNGYGSRGTGKGNRGPSKENPCHICGAFDHWSPDCPEKGSNKRRSSASSKSSSNSQGPTSPKKIPPKPGESWSRFRNDVKEYWCNKCGYWTKSHTADKHGKRDENSTNSSTTDKEQSSSSQSSSLPKKTVGFTGI